VAVHGAETHAGGSGAAVRGAETQTPGWGGQSTWNRSCPGPGKK